MGDCRSDVRRLQVMSPAHSDALQLDREGLSQREFGRFDCPLRTNRRVGGGSASVVPQWSLE